MACKTRVVVDQCAQQTAQSASVCDLTFHDQDVLHCARIGEAASGEDAAGDRRTLVHNNIARDMVAMTFAGTVLGVGITKVIAPAFQRQCAVFILPALALAADGFFRGIVILIDRLAPGRIRDAVGSHHKVGSVRLAVQHNIFARLGSKRLVTLPIRASQAAVMLFAVDVVDRGIFKLYSELWSSGKVKRKIGEKRFFVSDCG